MNRNVKFTKNFGPSMDPMVPNETGSPKYIYNFQTRAFEKFNHLRKNCRNTLH